MWRTLASQLDLQCCLELEVQSLVQFLVTVGSLYHSKPSDLSGKNCLLPFSQDDEGRGETGAEDGPATLSCQAQEYKDLTT